MFKYIKIENVVYKKNHESIKQQLKKQTNTCKIFQSNMFYVVYII